MSEETSVPAADVGTYDVQCCRICGKQKYSPWPIIGERCACSDIPVTAEEMGQYPRVPPIPEREFWERVYLAALDQARRDASPNVPWSERAAEVADRGLDRWRERWDIEARR